VGTINAPGNCAGVSGNAFCDALHDVKELMNDNYENYKKIGCTNSPIPLTDELMMSHVYGWAPFTENGCSANANNLENTPGYTDNNHARYLAVKLEFDKLNYGAYTKAFYNFNPWVSFIHGADYLNAPNVYAYSVDDAVGNIQAEGQGFIIDIGSTQNLENHLPASPPINISLGFDPKLQYRFVSYRVCKNDETRDKPVNPHFPSFVISANDPKNCPVYLLDNKTPNPQFYTFTVTQLPKKFPFFQNPSDAHWSQQTAGIIDCSGNTAFDQSSQLWCCQKLAGESGTGVFAFSTPDSTSVHQINGNFVITIVAEQDRTREGTACNMGQVLTERGRRARRSPPAEAPKARSPSGRAVKARGDSGAGE
jgi:hypothetical protein